MLDVLPLLGWPPLQEADCAFGLICPRRLGAIITDQSPASLEPEFDSLCILADANSICLTTTVWHGQIMHKNRISNLGVSNEHCLLSSHHASFLFYEDRLTINRKRYCLGFGHDVCQDLCSIAEMEWKTLATGTPDFG